MAKNKTKYTVDEKLGEIRVVVEVRRMDLAEGLTLRNDFSAFYFESDRGRIGSEPNVARAINRVLKAALVKVTVNDVIYTIDANEPLKNIPVFDNDEEYNREITDFLIRCCVKFNRFLGQQTPTNQLFREHLVRIEEEENDEKRVEQDNMLANPTDSVPTTSTTREENSTPQEGMSTSGTSPGSTGEAL